MVARAGGCYKLTFQGFRRVTQGYPLSPTILKVMVDAVVRHWVYVMVEGEGDQGGRRK